MAEHAHSIPTSSASATRDDFDEALTQAQIINDIIDRRSDASMGTPEPCAALIGWLSDQLRARLERIEVADQTMRRGADRGRRGQARQHHRGDAGG